MAGDPSNTHATQPPLHIYRPIPRRNFGSFADSLDSPTHDYAQATPPSAIENRRPSDFLAQLNARLLRTYNSRFDDSEEQEREYPPRNKSLLNLNSSTLSGIYDATSAGDQSVAETPWGTGAETPKFPPMSTEDREPSMRSQDSGLTMKKLSGKGAVVMEKPQGRKRSHSTKQPRQGIWKYAVLIGKLVSLFVFGIIYGVIVSHLHESRHFPRVPAVEGVDHSSHLYLASWGFFGVALGSLLPYVDLLWEAQRGDSETEDNKEGETPESPLSEQINEVVRSVAAFVGIAFAIRRLPWQSTLQLTLTLALVNPALWYILDRSKPGLSVSLTVTSVLTSFIFLSNPDVLPSPSLPVTMNATTQLPPMAPAAQQLFVGMVTYESLAVVTWVGSVLFCSCVCFGSIGRRLAVLEESGWKR